MSTRKNRLFAVAMVAATAQACAMGALAQTPAAGSTRSTDVPTDSATGQETAAGMKHDGMKRDSMSKTTAMPVTAQSFATQAATTDMAEIELGQLAMKNSADAAVKKFAEQMVKDHTASTAKLKTVAAKDNLTLPTSLDAQHAAVKTKLAGLQGADFDKAYGKEMARGHDKAVALFESASQTPDISGDLKQFAASTLPKIRQHKGMAHELHSKEGA